MIDTSLTIFNRFVILSNYPGVSFALTSEDVVQLFIFSHKLSRDLKGPTVAKNSPLQRHRNTRLNETVEFWRNFHSFCTCFPWAHRWFPSSVENLLSRPSHTFFFPLRRWETSDNSRNPFEIADLPLTTYTLLSVLSLWSIICYCYWIY